MRKEEFEQELERINSELESTKWDLNRTEAELEKAKGRISGGTALLYVSIWLTIFKYGPDFFSFLDRIKRGLDEGFSVILLIGLFLAYFIWSRFSLEEPKARIYLFYGYLTAGVVLTILSLIIAPNF